MSGQPATDTRERILAVAAKLFAQHGYVGTSVRDIAEQLGISNPSLYHHFRSKQELFGELLREPLAIVDIAVQEADKLRGEARARRVLGGLLDAMQVHCGIVMTAIHDANHVPNVRQDLLAAAQPFVAELLSKSAAKDRRDLRVQMTMAAVQGTVTAMIQGCSDSTAFTTQLALNRDSIIDFAIKLLRD